MTEDLDYKLVDSICRKLKKNDELGTRMTINRAKTEQYHGWSIDALKTATTLIFSYGSTLVKEATFNLLGCK